MMMLIDLHHSADNHHHGGDDDHVQDLDDDDAQDEQDSYDNVYEKEEVGGIESNRVWYFFYPFVLNSVLLFCPFCHFLKPFRSPQWH